MAGLTSLPLARGVHHITLVMPHCHRAGPLGAWEHLYLPPEYPMQRDTFSSSFPFPKSGLC